MPVLRAGKEQMYMNNADDITNEEFDTKSLYQIGYGLYVLTTRDGDKDNGCIVNTNKHAAAYSGCCKQAELHLRPDSKNRQAEHKQPVRSYAV